MKALNDYLREMKEESFEWGKHDCLTFTNEAWRRMYGFGWADDWIGRYMLETEYGSRPMGKDRLKSEFGFFSLPQAINTKLVPVNRTPPRGSLVATTKTKRYATGYALGISNGLKCAFLSDKGLKYLPSEDIDKVWINR